MREGRGGAERRATAAARAEVAGSGLPLVRWGDVGPWLHLAHANGFPPGAYAALARRLATRCRVVAAPLRPLHPGARPAEVPGWEPFAADILAALGPGAPGADSGPDDTPGGPDERPDGPVIGVGHSMGGVATVLAAVQRPDRFRAVVLVDPILFAGLRAFVWTWMRRLRVAHRLPLAAAARRRRAVWPSRAAARASWRSKELFAGVPDDVLDDYVAAALAKRPEGGYELRYPADWEAHVFETTPTDPWPAVARLGCPVLVLRGARSDAFTPAAAARLRRVLPHALVQDVPDTGHMLPFQRPEEVADRILAFVAGLR